MRKNEIFVRNGTYTNLLQLMAGVDEEQKIKLSELAITTDGKPRLFTVDSLGNLVSLSPHISEFYTTTHKVVAYSSSVTIDLNESNSFYIEQTGNIEINITPINKDNINQAFTLIMKQDSVGGRIITFNDNLYWKDELPTINTDPNAMNVFTFFSTDKGVTWYSHLVGTLYVNV